MRLKPRALCSPAAAVGKHRGQDRHQVPSPPWWKGHRHGGGASLPSPLMMGALRTMEGVPASPSPLAMTALRATEGVPASPPSLVVASHLAP